MRALRWFIVALCCSVLTGCMVARHQGPWAQDMFTVFDGHPATATARDTATNDCLGYAYNTPHTQGAVINGYQICMLQLGFRAPQGELPDAISSSIAWGSCADFPFLPVCMAEKEGWPLHPVLRWSRPNTTRYKIEGDASVCWARNVGVKYAVGVVRMDKCMAAMGYTVADPNSPILVWPRESTWPNCTKPEDQRNSIEKKWCLSGSSAAPSPVN